MDMTPVTEGHNEVTLGLMPKTAMKIMEFGCSSGAMAREFKKVNPACTYVGVDIEPIRADMAKRYCDQVMVLDIDTLDEAFYQTWKGQDCWVFGDTLEHLKDPWRVLRSIRPALNPDGCVIVCIPNAQNWSVVTRLAIGDFTYEPSGLLDQTHLRWFTRQTLFGLFESTGYRVEECISIILHDARSAKFLPHIGALAKEVGLDPEIAMRDAGAFQYVIRAVPA